MPMQTLQRLEPKSTRYLMQDSQTRLPEG